jgi:NAD-dependent deacetylase
MICKKTFSIDEVYKNLDKELPPKCSCGGILRPDVVFFGEPLPREALAFAENAAKNCEVFMVLGSSLLVYPAAQLPLIAKRNEAILIIINIDTTPMDEIADINIHESASQVLSEVIN